MSEVLPQPRFRVSERIVWRVGIAVLTLATVWINFWRLAAGARSEYYAAIAVSMSKSFSNFIFGALDPAGTVSLDKIPGSYWIPALFVKIFGFSTWSVNAPNALAGIGAALFSAFAARRLFGTYAGLFAGALIATTPIITAVSRSNQPQMFFLLALAVAADRASSALKSGSRRSLIWAGVWIGIAFHTYMLEAWAIWPALIIAWLVAAPVVIRERIKSLLIAGATSLGVSLIWIVIVTVTPASSRPYVGGTYHNSAWEMVFGYNGLGRFSATSTLSSATDNPIFRSFTPPFSGSAGFSRLFNNQVAGQISWLIPLAIVCAIVGIIAAYRKMVWNFAKANFLFFALWFLTFFWMFSKVAGMHQFYTTSLAIPMAFLIAGGLKILINSRSLISKIVVLVAAIGSAFWAMWISHKYQGFFAWAPQVALGLAVIGSVALFLFARPLAKAIGSALVAVSIIFVPTVWAKDVVNHPSSINPTAGPEMGNGFGGGRPGGGGPGGALNNSAAPKLSNPGAPSIGGQGPVGGFDPRNFRDPGHHDRPFSGGQGGSPGAGMGGGAGGPGGGFGQSASKEVVTYLKNNRGSAKYLLATFGGMAAAPYITATGDKILPIGGFDGQDPSPTLSKFKDLVRTGDVKYVLVGGMGGGQQGNQANTSTIETWVTTNCVVDAAAPSSVSLYTCSPEVALNN